MRSIDCFLARYDDNILCGVLKSLQTNTLLHRFHVNNFMKLTILDQVRLSSAIADCIQENRTLTHLLFGTAFRFSFLSFVCGFNKSSFEKGCAHRGVNEALRNNYSLIEHDFICSETIPFVTRNLVTALVIFFYLYFLLLIENPSFV